MKTKEKIEQTLTFMNELFPNASCELVFHKDYELVIAVMLSAQTTDKSVNKVTSVLFTKYDTLEKLKDASLEDIENIIKSIGLYKNKAKHVLEIANEVYARGGFIPNDENYLLTLPGVGVKTKNVVLAELYKTPVIAVDTHVERVSKRLGFANESDSPIEIEAKLEKIIDVEKRVKAHHQFIHFGRYFCLAKKPQCGDCKLKDFCKFYLK